MLLTRTEPSGEETVPLVMTIGATTLWPPNSSWISSDSSSLKKPSGASKARSAWPILSSARAERVARTESPTVRAPTKTIEHKAAPRQAPACCLRKYRRFRKRIDQKLMVRVVSISPRPAKSRYPFAMPSPENE